MSITRKRVGIRLLACLVSVISFLGCSKDKDILEEYEVVVVNEYFEDVSFSIGKYKEVELGSGERSGVMTIERGEYELVVETAGGLRMESKVHLCGEKKEVLVRVERRGDVRVEGVVLVKKRLF